MRSFKVDDVAADEFEAAAAWYEGERPGLGLEFIAEVNRTLDRIEHHETFVTAPVTAIRGGVVRREFVRRFPYVVMFVETDDIRRVIMIRRGTSDPDLWQSRI
ncbi:MAG: hypothetical protein H0T46_26750 [Deltaproteobacteria bacterium]|nr:hypothetical protein [Deltaproteobacteria bacterium]